MTAPRGSFWTVVGVFVLVGAPTGGLALSVVSLVEYPLESIGPGDLLRIPGSLFIGLVGGCLPAFLTGALSAAVSSRVDSKILWVLIAIVAGVAISTMIYGWSGGWVYFGPIGGLAALVSGLVALKVRPRWSN